MNMKASNDKPANAVKPPPPPPPPPPTTLQLSAEALQRFFVAVKAKKKFKRKIRKSLADKAKQGKA